MWIQAQQYMTANGITTASAQLAAGNVIQTAYAGPEVVFTYGSLIEFCVANGMTQTAAETSANQLMAYLQANNPVLNTILSQEGISAWNATSVAQIQGIGAAASLSSNIVDALVAKVSRPTVPLYQTWGISPENWVISNVTYLAGLAQVEAVSGLVNQILPVLPVMCSALGNTVTTNATVNAWLQAQYKTVLSGGTPKLPATLAELWPMVNAGQTS